jgi:hypothetical protein
VRRNDEAARLALIQGYFVLAATARTPSRGVGRRVGEAHGGRIAATPTLREPFPDKEARCRCPPSWGCSAPVFRRACRSGSSAGVAGLLRKQGSLGQIGLSSLVSLGLKFLWAPVVDRRSFPGRPAQVLDCAASTRVRGGAGCSRPAIALMTA